MCGRFCLRRLIVAQKGIADCASCGYPLRAVYVGQKEKCPMCATLNETISISGGASILPPVLIGIAAFLAGIIFGPSIAAAVKR